VEAERRKGRPIGPPESFRQWCACARRFGRPRPRGELACVRARPKSSAARPQLRAELRPAGRTMWFDVRETVRRTVCEVVLRPRPLAAVVREGRRIGRRVCSASALCTLPQTVCRRVCAAPSQCQQRASNERALGTYRAPEMSGLICCCWANERPSHAVGSFARRPVKARVLVCGRGGAAAWLVEAAKLHSASKTGGRSSEIRQRNNHNQNNDNH